MDKKEIEKDFRLLGIGLVKIAPFKELQFRKVPMPACFVKAEYLSQLPEYETKDEDIFLEAYNLLMKPIINKPKFNANITLKGKKCIQKKATKKNKKC